MKLVMFPRLPRWLVLQKASGKTMEVKGPKQGEDLSVEGLHKFATYKVQPSPWEDFIKLHMLSLSEGT